VGDLGGLKSSNQVEVDGNSLLLRLFSNKNQVKIRLITVPQAQYNSAQRQRLGEIK